MSSSPAVKEYINNLANTTTNEEAKQLYTQMKDLYDKKLWHQLTTKLETLVELPIFDKGNDLVQFYNNFIKDFEKKLNQTTLLKLVLRITRQITDTTENINFLQKTLEKLNPVAEKQAYALCLTQIAFLKLKQNHLEESKTDLDKVGSVLDSMTGADQIVYSNYYRVLALYHKVKVSPTAFYKNSLMFLLYTPDEKIPLPEQQALAFDLGIAALVSTDIHNFGELTAQPILSSLNGTPGEWLRHFLIAFNAGDIGRFESFLVNNKNEFESQPALKTNLSLLKEKISLLALMELVFSKPSEGRTFSFKDISAATRIPVEEVELLLMKSFSLKLVKGVIDEVEQTATIWWVQPRVLDIPQISKMNERLGSWIGSVQQLTTYMQNETAPELLT